MADSGLRREWKIKINKNKKKRRERKNLEKDFMLSSPYELWPRRLSIALFDTQRVVSLYMIGHSFMFQSLFPKAENGKDPVSMICCVEVPGVR